VAPTRAGRSPEPEEAATITPYRDGPLLVRGPFRLQDMYGREIEVKREIVALCRCGKSRMRPFCDGSHKLVRFKAPTGAEQRRNGSA
jgi:CDGSH-type Zn-finger protein